MHNGKFVVRSCGCHRNSLDVFTTVASSRPLAVRAVERIGRLDPATKVAIRGFLEGADAGTEDGNYSTLWVFGAADIVRCKQGTVHWGSIFAVDEEV